MRVVELILLRALRTLVQGLRNVLGDENVDAIDGYTDGTVRKFRYVRKNTQLNTVERKGIKYLTI